MKLLREVALNCTRCDLFKTRTQVVFGVGPEQPQVDLVVIGEGPGEDEDAQGRPFVGRSGRFLDSLLSQGGFARNEVWLTNIVKSRPATLEKGRLTNRVPNSTEIKACEIWWKNELRLLQPKIILCLGATSAKTLTGNKNFQITKDRGEWMPGPNNSELLVTFHPAYILRLREPQYSNIKGIVIEDIKKVAQRLEALKSGRAEPQPWQQSDDGIQLSLF
jgi:DNA polymerase